MMGDYDLVFIQELVSTPKYTVFEDSSKVFKDREAELFFNGMEKNGFQYLISEEDTGSGIFNHKNNTSTEWWVAFYEPKNIQKSEVIKTEFLAADRTDNKHFERVPYAFYFQFYNTSELVFISTHSKPGSSQSDMRRRREEISEIYKYVLENNELDKDFVILGAMNVKDCE